MIIRYYFVLFSVICVAALPLHAQEQFTFQDVMQFENLQHPVLADDGSWLAYSVWPERGDGEARFEQRARRGARTYTVQRGERPRLSPDARFGAVIQRPPFLDYENAPRDNRP